MSDLSISLIVLNVCVPQIVPPLYNSVCLHCTTSCCSASFCQLQTHLLIALFKLIFLHFLLFKTNKQTANNSKTLKSYLNSYFGKGVCLTANLDKE